MEGELPNEEFGRLLVLADFTESDGSGTETMRLLDTTLKNRNRTLLLGMTNGVSVWNDGGRTVVCKMKREVSVRQCEYWAESGDSRVRSS